jgi:hypothetical protein
MSEATAILEAVPQIASLSLAAAAVLGDAIEVAETVAADPTTAVAIDETRGWPPLLYACYSRWQRVAPGRAAGVTEVIRLLLEVGASPNTNDGARYPRSALKGAVEANNPDGVKLLLEAGANPDIGQPSVRRSDGATMLVWSFSCPTEPGSPVPGLLGPPSPTTMRAQWPFWWRPSAPTRRRRK